LSSDVSEATYITSFSLMNCSNSFRLTSFFVPTKSTNGQLGVLSILSILLMPMLLYYEYLALARTDLSLNASATRGIDEAVVAYRAQERKAPM